VTVRE